MHMEITVENNVPKYVHTKQCNDVKVISSYGKKLSVLLEGYYEFPVIVKYFT